MPMSTNINVPELTATLKQKIQSFGMAPVLRQEGRILSVGDGVVKIHGLDDVALGESLRFENGERGLVLNLHQDSVGAVVLGSDAGLSEGQAVYATREILKVPVGEALLGRVVDALGNPVDEKGRLETDQFEAVEKVAPGVVWRKSITESLPVGIKSIDTMVPIGRGQRELIIGDRQTGKTSIAIDAIINQKNTGVKCIYVAIGQKSSSIALMVRLLEEHDALQYTTIVIAGAADSAALQYIAPYSGCTMGEYFRDKGQDALIIYDDLTKHAWAYRQISLLLRRPPGREAYPGDVFYLHSRLLERAAHVNEAYVEEKTQGQVKGQSGSLTALPIIETQVGDVSGFISTNVISITDGQIFLETDLFNANIRPAINAGLSVSRIGGAAQTPIIKKLAGGIRLALAQYRELAAFAQIASELDETTRKQLERGQKVTELLKQPQYKPFSVAEIAVSMFAVEKGYIDDVPIKSIVHFEKSLLDFAKSHHGHFLETINRDPQYSSAVEQELDILLKTFKKDFVD